MRTGRRSHAQETSQRRSRSRVITMVVLALAVAGLPASTGLTAAAADTCPDVELVWARGSGEPLEADSYQKMRDEMEKRLGQGDITFDSYEVGANDSHHHRGYPAVGIKGWDVSNALGAAVSAGEAETYGWSVDQGAFSAAEHVTGRHVRCPATQFVMAGFSQGAQVIGEALRNVSSAADNVAFVALFGDPKLYLPEGRGAYVKNPFGGYIVAPPACYGQRST